LFIAARSRLQAFLFQPNTNNLGMDKFLGLLIGLCFLAVGVQGIVQCKCFLFILNPISILVTLLDSKSLEAQVKLRRDLYKQQNLGAGSILFGYVERLPARQATVFFGQHCLLPKDPNL
jgi:hypothetical protein